MNHPIAPDTEAIWDFFPRGEMVDEFDLVAFALSPGEVSGVFRTPF